MQRRRGRRTHRRPVKSAYLYCRVESGGVSFGSSGGGAQLVEARSQGVAAEFTLERVAVSPGGFADGDVGNHARLLADFALECDCQLSGTVENEAELHILGLTAGVRRTVSDCRGGEV